ncbi:MAG: site-specific integrase [Candidatus Solibacter sp.]|jgi:integrase
MLNIFRRHRDGCSRAGTRSQDCPSKPKCSIHFEGIDGAGVHRKRQALIDPASGSGVRDWNRAAEIIRDLELPTPIESVQKPQIGIQEAIDSFIAFKARRSIDVQRKARLILGKLKAFLEKRKKLTVAEIMFSDLVEFRAGWSDALTTQRRNQEAMKGFFRFCVKSDFIVKSPATDLDSIPEGRPKTEPFTREEMDRIFPAVANLPDEYGRRGQPIADQTRAFILVMRYTGMSIGDAAKLEKTAVDGCRIRTYRKKTGEDVFAKVPPFVIEALNRAPHDSERYFFWTGEGKLHTRTSKWGSRLQRLFVAADVRTVESEKKRRSGGKLKTEAETVKVSKATPHMFRHTLVRDLLERGTPMEEIAELLGNSMKVVEKYYSKWDIRRQARLEKTLEDFWQNDPLTQNLAS